MNKVVVLILMIAGVAFSQHSIPFASSSNTIELSVANVSSVATSHVVVNVAAMPIQNQPDK
jgi:hypothetical protein